MIFEDEIKKIAPDINLAKGLVSLAKLRLDKLLKINLDDENPFEVVERCYNALKEFADALLAVKGCKSRSHEATIEFLRRNYIKEIGIFRLEQLDRYRIFRNDIYYRGKTATKEDAEKAVIDTKAISNMLLKLLEKEGI